MQNSELSSQPEVQSALDLIIRAGDAACDATPSDPLLSQIMIIASYTGTIADMLKQAHEGRFDPNWKYDIRDALATIQQAGAAAQGSLHRWKSTPKGDV